MQLRLDGTKILVFLFFSAVVLSAATPIADPDFFWHISNGRWIWENRALPFQDPFAYTSPDLTEYTSDTMNFFTLKAYWISQTIIYLFYRAGSYEGVIFYKAAVYAGIVLFIYLFLRRENVRTSMIILFLLPVISHSLFYYIGTWRGERPSYISFLFAVILFYLLEGLRKKSHRGYLVSLPFVMMLWANMHGGFTLGIVMVLIYIADIPFRAGFQKKNVSGEMRLFLISAFISILATLLNPNTYQAFQALLHQTNIADFIGEWKSPMYFYNNGMATYLIHAVVPIVLLAPFARRLSLPQGVLVVFLSIMAFSSVRLIPFLIFITTPLIVINYSVFIEKAARKLRLEVLLGPLILCLILLISYSNIKGTVMNNPVVHGAYPYKSAGFMRDQKPKPRIFNHFDWGGFLMWELWPDYKPFIDGRVLSLKVLNTYQQVLYEARPDYHYNWKQILSYYDINVVIIPPVNAIGRYVTLFGSLVEDAGWTAVYMDDVSFIFLKNRGEHKRIIHQYALDNRFVLASAIARIEKYLHMGSHSYRHYISLGILNAYLGDNNKAVRFLEAAFTYRPGLKTFRVNTVIARLKKGDPSVKAKEIVDALYGHEG